jgi:hypothetical protein
MPMRCPRCQGFMITTQLRELWSSDVIDGWRCLLCGENIDAVIEGNRTGHSPPVQNRARVPGAPTARYIKGRLKHEHR